MTLRPLLAAALFAALPALAQDAASERIKAELKKSIPEATVDAVRKLPYGNLYEVQLGTDLIYTDDKATFILIGNIVDLKTKENVTETRMRQVNRVKFAELPLDASFKVVRGNGSRKVAIFADPNCGYCKRFERDLLAVNDLTVHYFLYPILAQDSVDKSKAVWCAPDKAKAWLDFMTKDVPITGDGKCTTPIEKVLAFGKQKRIQGTPTIIFEDGERVPGAMPVADFEKKLASLAAPATAPRAATK